MAHPDRVRRFGGPAPNFPVSTHYRYFVCPTCKYSISSSEVGGKTTIACPNHKAGIVIYMEYDDAKI